MAHYRKPLAAAAALNTAIFVVEAVAGFKADSLSLIMDSVHNLSDEMALVFLYLAFVLPHGISRHLLRSANVFNCLRSPHRRLHRRVDHPLHRARGFCVERGAHLAWENRLRPFRPHSRQRKGTAPQASIGWGDTCAWRLCPPYAPSRKSVQAKAIRKPS